MPDDRVRELEKAGALIVAEIDRLTVPAGGLDIEERAAMRKQIERLGATCIQFRAGGGRVRISMPDPHPGSCKNYRGGLRCLDYDDEVSNHEDRFKLANKLGPGDSRHEALLLGAWTVSAMGRPCLRGS